MGQRVGKGTERQPREVPQLMIKAKSGRTLAERLAYYSHDDAATGCRLWHGGGHRYGELGITEGGKKQMQRAHRLMWELHNGPIPEGMRVLHRCDTPRCIRLDHLWLGTQEQNIADMDRKGRRGARRGSAHAQAILTEEKVKAIRAAKGTHQQIADRFGLASSGHVGNIRRRLMWKHVP
jgi:hypothetical protein